MLSSATKTCARRCLDLIDLLVVQRGPRNRRGTRSRRPVRHHPSVAEPTSNQPDGARPCPRKCPRAFDTQTITRGVHCFVAFRYGCPMTVPCQGRTTEEVAVGRGSGAGLSRTRRGDEEPATLEVALADGDELARAIDRIRQLRIELAAAGDARKELEAALAAERRRTETARRRLDRAQAEDWSRSGRPCRTGRGTQRTRRARSGSLRVENPALRLRLEETEQPPVANGPGRAIRRKAVKQDRRNR